MEEKSTQCNTIKKELDNLRSELDLAIDENNNCMNSVKDVLECRSNKKGRPYTDKLREVYYFLCSKGVGINNMNSVIRSVLSLVDIEISDLPSKSTVGNMSSEVSLDAQQHLNEALASSDNFTMQCDATTKRGHHYYTTQLTTAENTLTVGVSEVIDGKATTYVSCVNETLSSICDPGSVLNKVSSFMTDRSATEQKVINILNESVDNTADSFKFSVHPLLVF
ncbi:unnamed protein product [Mytilus edulis]|uniref:Uncharacterized protein n=1 Tax=Mytilus edulis TaxID=6550 RepID=A0A8S3U2J4_MYTED|nr:unnamed protein product [Mytilus edulis]